MPATLNREYLSESKYMSGPRQEMHGRESRATRATCPDIGAGTEVRLRMWGKYCTGGDGRRVGEDLR